MPGQTAAWSGALSETNAAQYLRQRGIDTGGARIHALGGGVSNTVLLVEAIDGKRLVLKQALGKLRVEQEWLSDCDRIFREAAALRMLAPILPDGSLPKPLFEDRENFIYAMNAAPDGSACWKDLLLAGEIAPEIAEKAGALLAAMVSATWRREEWDREFGDQTVFKQLRIDPYYRSTAARHPDLAPFAERLIKDSAARRFSIVHGDWSPKNFLVHGDRVMAIDFEVVHFGDPTFDTAFLLNHLRLKSFYRPQWASQYTQAAKAFWRTFIAGTPRESWIEPATIQHLGWLMLARVDGKSPAEYLKEPHVVERVRRFARKLIARPPASIAEVFTEGSE